MYIINCNAKQSDLSIKKLQILQGMKLNGLSAS